MNKSKFLIVFLLFLIFPNQSSHASSLPQESLPEFDSISVGFHNLYEITVSVENGQTVARSVYDPADSPHYSYDSETQTWIDNHPGRNQMELTFPPVRESGRTIWKEFQGYEWQEDTKTYVENAENKAEWNQDLMQYEYVNLTHDEGHPVLWSTMMDYDKEGLYDEDMGKVNFCETIQTEDFVLGESGIRIDFFIDINHPNVEYWQFNDPEIAGKYFGEMYLKQYPELKGKHLIVRVSGKDLTYGSEVNKANRETYFQHSLAKLENGFNTGYIENISKNTDLVTISSSHNQLSTIGDISTPYVHLLATLQIKNNHIFEWEKFEPDRKIQAEMVGKIIEEGGYNENPLDSVTVKFK